MSQDLLSVLAASSAAHMQDTQDMLGVLFDDQFLTDGYHQLSALHAELTQCCNETPPAERARIEQQIKAAACELRDGLWKKRRNSSEREWKEFVKLCLLHPLCELVYQDPFTHRAHAKPREYAGDAVLMDFIYSIDDKKGQSEDTPKGPPEDTSALGRVLFDAVCNFQVCAGVRNRRKKIAETIDRLARKIPRLQILSVAAGHLREAGMTGSLKRRRLGRWVAMDSDTESLQEVQRCYEPYGVEVVAGTVRQLLGRRLNLGEFDFIYSTGLYDYLQQPVGKRLTERMYEMLRPGGQLLIANLLPEVDAWGLMESYMDWQLVYRTQRQMLDLAMAIDRAQVRSICLFTDDSQSVVFLQITKK